VGAVTLQIDGCDGGIGLSTVIGGFSIATNVGTLVGDISGSENLVSPNTVDFELTLTVGSGSELFSATTGTLHVSIQWTPGSRVGLPDGAPEPMTGSVTTP
jgi:hypothetical protein